MVGHFEVGVQEAMKAKQEELDAAKSLLSEIQQYICWNEMSGVRARTNEEKWEDVMGVNPRTRSASNR